MSLQDCRIETTAESGSLYIDLTKRQLKIQWYADATHLKLWFNSD